MKIISSLVLSLLLANSQAISIQKSKTVDRISAESKDIINNAVNDVLKITQSPVQGDSIIKEETNVHHNLPTPVVAVESVKTVPVPVAVPQPYPVVEEHHHHHHHFSPPAIVHQIEERVVPVTKYVPVPGPIQKAVVVERPASPVTTTVTTSNAIPTVFSVPATRETHSSVVRAVADANMKTAEETIND
jgi:hypothetical protein